jgi:hypothetical protein
MTNASLTLAPHLPSAAACINMEFIRRIPIAVKMGFDLDNAILLQTNREKYLHYNRASRGIETIEKSDRPGQSGRARLDRFRRQPLARAMCKYPHK